MIIKIAVKTPQKRTYCFIDCISAFTIPMDIDDKMFRTINERATYLASELTPTIMVGSTIVQDGYLVSLKSLKLSKAHVENFLQCYGDNLHRCFSDRPDQYVGEFNETNQKMRIAILEGSYNKDSESFKMTCKNLKLNHTYKDINSYLRGEK